MRVDGDISDLFFNTQHATDSDGSFEQLEEEAADVLNSLRRLGTGPAIRRGDTGLLPRTD